MQPQIAKLFTGSDIKIAKMAKIAYNSIHFLRENFYK